MEIDQPTISLPRNQESDRKKTTLREIARFCWAEEDIAPRFTVETPAGYAAWDGNEEDAVVEDVEEDTKEVDLDQLMRDAEEEAKRANEEEGKEKQKKKKTKVVSRSEFAFYRLLVGLNDKFTKTFSVTKALLGDEAADYAQNIRPNILKVLATCSSKTSLEDMSKLLKSKYNIMEVVRHMDLVVVDLLTKHAKTLFGGADKRDEIDKLISAMITATNVYDIRIAHDTDLTKTSSTSALRPFLHQGVASRFYRRSKIAENFLALATSEVFIFDKVVEDARALVSYLLNVAGLTEKISEMMSITQMNSKRTHHPLVEYKIGNLRTRVLSTDSTGKIEEIIKGLGELWGDLDEANYGLKDDQIRELIVVPIESLVKESKRDILLVNFFNEHLKHDLLNSDEVPGNEIILASFLKDKVAPVRDDESWKGERPLEELTEALERLASIDTDDVSEIFSDLLVALRIKVGRDRSRDEKDAGSEFREDMLRQFEDANTSRADTNIGNYPALANKMKQALDIMRKSWTLDEVKVFLENFEENHQFLEVSSSTVEPSDVHEDRALIINELETALLDIKKNIKKKRGLMKLSEEFEFNSKKLQDPKERKIGPLIRTLSGMKNQLVKQKGDMASFAKAVSAIVAFEALVTCMIVKAKGAEEDEEERVRNLTGVDTAMVFERYSVVEECYKTFREEYGKQASMITVEVSLMPYYATVQCEGIMRYFYTFTENKEAAVMTVIEDFGKALSKQDEKDYSDPDAMVLGKVYRAKAETKLKELEAYLLNDLTTTAEGEQEEADSPNIQQRAIATEARVFKEYLDDKSEGENKSDRMRSSIQRAFFSPDPKTLEELKDAANAYLGDDRSRLKTYLQDFGEKMGRLRDKLQSGLEVYCLGKLKRMPDKSVSDEQVKEVATKFAALLTDWIVMDRDESRFYELLEILDDDQIKRAVHVVRSVNVGERANVGAIFTNVSTEFDASLGKIPKAKGIVQAALSNLVAVPKASSTPSDEDDGGKMNIVNAFQLGKDNDESATFVLPMAAAATSRFYSKKTDHRSKPEVDYLLSFFPNSQTHSADIRNAIASVISVSYMALQGVPVTQWLGEILPASLKAGETKKFWEAVDKENRAEIIKEWDALIRVYEEKHNYMTQTLHKALRACFVIMMKDEVKTIDHFITSLNAQDLFSPRSDYNAAAVFLALLWGCYYYKDVGTLFDGSLENDPASTALLTNIHHVSEIYNMLFAGMDDKYQQLRWYGRGLKKRRAVFDAESSEKGIRLSDGIVPPSYMSFVVQYALSNWERYREIVASGNSLAAHVGKMVVSRDQFNNLDVDSKLGFSKNQTQLRDRDVMNSKIRALKARRMPRIKLAKDMEGAESVRYVMQFLGMPGSGDPVIKMEDADYLKFVRFLKLLKKHPMSLFGKGDTTEIEAPLQDELLRLMTIGQKDYVNNRQSLSELITSLFDTSSDLYSSLDDPGARTMVYIATALPELRKNDYDLYTNFVYGVRKEKKKEEDDEEEEGDDEYMDYDDPNNDQYESDEEEDDEGVVDKYSGLKSFIKGATDGNHQKFYHTLVKIKDYYREHFVTQEVNDLQTLRLVKPDTLLKLFSIVSTGSLGGYSDGTFYHVSNDISSRGSALVILFDKLISHHYTKHFVKIRSNGTEKPLYPDIDELIVPLRKKLRNPRKEISFEALLAKIEEKMENPKIEKGPFKTLKSYITYLNGACFACTKFLSKSEDEENKFERNDAGLKLIREYRKQAATTSETEEERGGLFIDSEKEKPGEEDEDEDKEDEDEDEIEEVKDSRKHNRDAALKDLREFLQRRKK